MAVILVVVILMMRFCVDGAPQLATYGYVAYDSKKDRIIVAFRGTTNLQNWITNLKTARTQFLNTGTSVHNGFNSAYMSVRDKVLASVNEFLGAHRSARIMVVGHSLGGMENM